MQPKTIALTGGTGFLGSALVPRLARAGWHVRVLTRRPERHRELLVVPQVRLVKVRLGDDTSLERELDGCAALVNFVGILNADHRDGREFTTLHAELPGRLAAACKRAGVGRMVHISALRADAENGPSQYLRSKGAGEQALRREAGTAVACTILQPSVVYGPGDSFTNRFAALLDLPSPFMPLPKPNARFAPVHVDDVMQAILTCLDNRDTHGKTYQLCGPQVMSLREVVTLIRDTLGISRRIVGMPDTLARLQAFLAEFVPGKPFSRDNLKSLQLHSICDSNGFEKLGIAPRNTAVWMARTVAQSHTGQRLDALRRRAGRL